MNIALIAILVPLGAGLVCTLLRRQAVLLETIAVAVSAVSFVCSLGIFMGGGSAYAYGTVPLLGINALSRVTVLGIGFFSVVVGIFSVGYFRGWRKANIYYGFFLMTVGSAMAVALAESMLIFICAWGFLGITLFVLVNLGGDGAAPAAKKTMIVVGGADAFMVLGAALIAHIRGDNLLDMTIGGAAIPLTGGAALAAYLCFAVAAFAKAGAMPFHSWIPDCAEHAPVPVTAFLPSALDKLLGIYLIAMVSLRVFVMNAVMQYILLVVGGVTIIAAVMMAMVQHDLKKLLGYHAVSQVGYMIVGIGTGVPIGIVGGLFHMVNNSLYKTCLFLAGGIVEKKTGTSDLDRLGGLASVMPISFVAALIASLAISGVPPFNGFASKWMVYQGILEMGKSGGSLWVVWLTAAMFGSALTLASFVKVLHAVFLGQPSEALVRKGTGITEARAVLWMPMAACAVLCVVFGVFALPVASNFFSSFLAGGSFGSFGFWQPGLATVLLLVGVAAGILIYWVGRRLPVRESDSFVGGEARSEEMALSGVDFYATIKDMAGLRYVYRKASEKSFDLYDQGRRAVFALAESLRAVHSGLLPLYLAWCVAGLLILLFVFIR